MNTYKSPPLSSVFCPVLSSTFHSHPLPCMDHSSGHLEVPDAGHCQCPVLSPGHQGLPVDAGLSSRSKPVRSRGVSEAMSGRRQSLHAHHMVDTQGIVKHITTYKDWFLACNWYSMYLLSLLSNYIHGAGLHHCNHIWKDDLHDNIYWYILHSVTGSICIVFLIGKFLLNGGI